MHHRALTVLKDVLMMRTMMMMMMNEFALTWRESEDCKDT